MRLLGKELINNKDIKVLGTYHIENDSLMQSNTASGISLSLKGNMVTIKLDRFSYRDETNTTPIGIITNYDYKNKEVIYLSGKENEIKFNLSSEYKTYSILKLDEAEDDTIFIKEIIIDGEIGKREIKKEALVIGDSTTAAYGNLGTLEDARTTMNSDGTQGYTYMALTDLGYDTNMLTASGFGVYASFWTDPQVKPIVNAFNAFSIMNIDIPFDYSTYNPELIVLSLGTNDLSYCADTKDEEEMERRKENFSVKYYEFIKMLTDKYPSSKIYMCYGCCREKEIFESLHKTYDRIKSENKPVYLVKLEGDGLGSASHPSLKNHYEMKEILKKAIIDTK